MNEVAAIEKTGERIGDSQRLDLLARLLDRRG